MTLTQAVVYYVVALAVLLCGLGLSLRRLKMSGQKLPSLAAIKIIWRGRFVNNLHSLSNREFWLKVLLTTFISVSAGVSIAIFMVPYGSGWMVIGLVASLLLLAVLLPYLLA